ncbi:MAG: hypothetical protein ACOXZU_11665 [Bacteroidales bacterium]|jgi:hypothetical protein|nr:hypothetical protein [Bacteroidales bacterium]
MNNKIDFDLIESFILGNLSTEEEKQFLNRLENDEEFLKAFNFRSKIQKYWVESEQYSTTNKHIKELLVINQKRKKRITFYYTAASIAIVLGIAGLLVIQKDNKLITNEISNSVIDTNKTLLSPVQQIVQPQKGNYYIMPIEYNSLDTLIIYRPKGVINVLHVFIKDSDNKIVLEFELKTDSITIPLKQIRPGLYKWEISGTSSSGDFILKETPENYEQSLTK